MTEASGVRSSWLALAMKSERSCSVRQRLGAVLDLDDGERLGPEGAVERQHADAGLEEALAALVGGEAHPALLAVGEGRAHRLDEGRGADDAGEVRVGLQAGHRRVGRGVGVGDAPGAGDDEERRRQLLDERAAEGGGHRARRAGTGARRRGGGRGRGGRRPGAGGGRRGRAARAAIAKSARIAPPAKATSGGTASAATAAAKRARREHGQRGQVSRVQACDPCRDAV